MTWLHWLLTPEALAPEIVKKDASSDIFTDPFPGRSSDSDIVSDRCEQQKHICLPASHSGNLFFNGGTDGHVFKPLVPKLTAVMKYVEIC